MLEEEHTHLATAALEPGLRHEEEHTDQEEGGGDGCDEIHPSPAHIDDDMRCCDAQHDDDDSLCSKDAADPGVSFMYVCDIL